MSRFHEDRNGLITGSQCHILFPKRDNPATRDTYAKQLAQQMYFGFIEQTTSWHTEHGHYSEPIAHAEYCRLYGPVPLVGFSCRGQFGGTPDALGVDYKCPTSMTSWLNYLYDGISNEQYHQAQMYMWLTNSDNWTIAAYLNEPLYMNNDGEIYPVEKDKRFILVKVERDIIWSRTLQERAPVILEARDKYYSQLVKKFGPCQR